MKESQNLKALCQMIMDQRSDIEQFFLEALEQVKEEKRRKLEAQKNEQNQKNKSLMYQDSMMNYMQQENDQKQEKITVELADLDWEDRERNLRLLFSKMNTGQSAGNWRETEDETPSQEGGRAGSSHLATAQLNQSFREQEDEDDYDQEQIQETGHEEDAQVFAQTNIPDNYNEDDMAPQQYYDEEEQS